MIMDVFVKRRLIDLQILEQVFKWNHFISLAGKCGDLRDELW